MSQLKVNTIRHTGASSDAITLASDGTATAKITNVAPGNRNIIINGACQVAQRGTSTTTSGGFSVDRFNVFHGGTDEAPAFAQVDVTSNDPGPWEKGFRKALRVTNGNQTGGAGAADYVWLQYKIESQDIANSGWNYTSASSYITLSFWVKSSVAQEFKGWLQTADGTAQNYPFTTGSLSADTWTKVTKTIPGHANLQFDNNNEVGLTIHLTPFFGTDYTNDSVTEDAWQAYASGTRAEDSTSTWYTTNDAQFETTGWQLEVGDTATDYEHRSYHDELLKCQRYYYLHADSTNKVICSGTMYENTAFQGMIPFPVTMRIGPALVYTSSGSNPLFVYANNANDFCDDASLVITDPRKYFIQIDGNLGVGNTDSGAWSRIIGTATIAFNAEL